MTEALSMSKDLTGGLLALAWAGVVLLHIWALVRMMRRGTSRRIQAVRRPAPAKRATRAMVAAIRAPRVAPARSAIPARPMDGAAHINRLFAILDGAIKGSERAVAAHVAAARQLDSAEYQLVRLFDEFPILTAARARTAAAVRTLDVRPALVPHALAA